MFPLATPTQGEKARPTDRFGSEGATDKGDSQKRPYKHSRPEGRPHNTAQSSEGSRHSTCRETEILTQSHQTPHERAIKQHTAAS